MEPSNPPRELFEALLANHGLGAAEALALRGKVARGLHSFTSQLNLSAFYGIRGARRGCAAHVKVLGGVQGV